VKVQHSSKLASVSGVSRTMAKKYLMKAMAYCQQRLEEME